MKTLGAGAESSLLTEIHGEHAGNLNPVYIINIVHISANMGNMKALDI